MNRRHFLQASSALSASHLLSRAALAATEQLHDEYFLGYQRALARDPRYVALKGVNADLSCESCTVTGRIPADLQGTLYRNGPALFERAQTRYQHWFDGDGMVHAWRLNERGASHQGRFVRTPKFMEENAQGKFLYNAFGTSFKNAKPITIPDAANVANTSVVPHAGRLFALWEGGSAFELEPNTLQTIGAVDWGSNTQRVPFSAHPKIDAQGVMWNFGFVGNALVIYRIDAQGKLQSVGVVRGTPMGMVHDFLVTQNYLLFVIPPANLDTAAASKGAFIDAFTPTNAALQVVLVRKDDLSKVQRFELDPGFVFHFGNAYEDQQGVVHFDYVHHNTGSVMTDHMRRLMRGDEQYVEQRSAHTALVSINPTNGKIQTQSIAGQVEMPRVDPRVVGQRYTQLLHIAQRDGVHSAAFASCIVRKVDINTGKIDQYNYGEGHVVEEHIFVPKKLTANSNTTNGAIFSDEGKGWALGTSLNFKTQQTSLNIFDASNLAAGPVAQITVPYAIPLGFHGNFLRS